MILWISLIIININPIFAGSLSKSAKNVCESEEKYKVNVTKYVPVIITTREYRWCMSFPPRCSVYSKRKILEEKQEEEEKTKLLSSCCPGYIENNNDCVLDCTSFKCPCQTTPSCFKKSGLNQHCFEILSSNENCSEFCSCLIEKSHKNLTGRYSSKLDRILVNIITDAVTFAPDFVKSKNKSENLLQDNFLRNDTTSVIISEEIARKMVNLTIANNIETNRRILLYGLITFAVALTGIITVVIAIVATVLFLKFKTGRNFEDLTSTSCCKVHFSKNITDENTGTNAQNYCYPKCFQDSPDLLQHQRTLKKEGAVLQTPEILDFSLKFSSNVPQTVLPISENIYDEIPNNMEKPDTSSFYVNYNKMTSF